MGSVPPDLTPGTHFASKYELIRKVGSGAMGQVWAARHLSLGEEVAIKVVLRDVAHEDGSSNDSRFLLEARVAAQLSRKTRHIVSVTDHGEEGPYSYLVMELLEGESLDARLMRTGPMVLSKVVPLVYQIARALAVAHADGIVHRDLKPSNVFVTVDEEGKALIKILDFGIAKLQLCASRPRLPMSAISANDAKHKTLRGFLLGTPAYMSPEQARGKAIDHRADVWALAVIAYHLLTRRFPFDGETSDELFARLCRVEPIPLASHRDDLPPGVYELFERAFTERLNERFQTAVAFAGALEQVATAQHRAAGLPNVMGSISIPPPNQVAEPKTKDSKRDTSSLVVAGVPNRRKTVQRIAAGAALFALLLGAGTFAYRAQQTAKEPAVGLAAGASNTAIVAAAATPAAPSEERNLIPPPPEPKQFARPEDLPAAPPTQAAPTPPSPAPQTITTTASLPVEPAPPNTNTNAAERPAPRPAPNKSEVF